jgi:hypothetical protein
MPRTLRDARSTLFELGACRQLHGKDPLTMTNSKRVARRNLFSVFRRALGASEPERSSPTTFSLSAFYERRPAPSSDSGDLPHFRVREDLSTVETTKVGAGLPESPAQGARERIR